MSPVVIQFTHGLGLVPMMTIAMSGVPRIGETVMICNCRYTVSDVIWNPDTYNPVRVELS